MKRLIVSALAAALAVSALAQGTLRQATPESHGMDSEKLAQVDRVINDAIAAKEIPGAVLSVVRGNDIVYLKAYGNKSVVPTVEPMTTETMFDLASVSNDYAVPVIAMLLIVGVGIGVVMNYDKIIDRDGQGTRKEGIVNLLWVVGYIIIGLAIIAAVIALINSKLKMSL